MAEIDKLIAEGEKTNEEGASKFESSVRLMELSLADEIRKLFKNVDVTAGKLATNQKTIDFLAGLDKRIHSALTKTGYKTRVSELLKNFDVIKANNIKLHDVINKVNITSDSLTSVQRIEVQNTIDKLIGTGINGQFVAPMRDALYRNIILGGSVADAEKIISDFVISEGNNKSVLNRYVGQVARDTLSQFDGMIQGTISEALGLNDWLYSGSIILDSRAQCIYWVDKRILLRDEMESQINTAINKGILGGKRCSGMIEQTTTSTFSTYRGGYNCRHRAIAINADKFKQGRSNLPSLQKRQKAELAILEKKAKKGAPIIDALGIKIAKKNNGTVTPINFKSAESIIRKANDELFNQIDLIKDAVRNTIIVERANILNVVADLKAEKTFLRAKTQIASSDPLGYSGTITNNLLENGLITETQVNTKWMIYAKEPKEIAISILGRDVYNQIKKIKGIEGGLGHVYYEDYRKLRISDPDYLKKRAIIEKKSRAYYANFRD